MLVAFLVEILYETIIASKLLCLPEVGEAIIIASSGANFKNGKQTSHDSNEFHFYTHSHTKALLWLERVVC